MDEITLIGITTTITAMLTIIVVLYVIQNNKIKGFKKKLELLEIEKNKIASTPVVPELAKIEAYLTNDKIKVMYTEWKNRFDDIRDRQVPRITDMLLEADYSLSQMDYKATMYKIAKLEMEIYKVRTNAEFLLGEVKDLTTSEERSRKIITKYKRIYRDLYDRYNRTKDDYGTLREVIELQFENISNKFDDYEDVLDDNKINEINTLTTNIEDMLKHMEVVLDEIPSILLLVNNVIPKKIDEVMKSYEDLTKDGYSLDYLNVEYNITEAKKKMADIKDRADMLNMKDSLLELKVLLKYFEGLLTDFEKEKVNKKEYEENTKVFTKKLTNTNKLVEDIFKKLGEIRKVYNLDDNDIKLLEDIKSELKKLNDDYKVLITHTGNGIIAYSKLNKELELLINRLNVISESLDSTLDTIGSMKEDESRARKQLDEIKNILKKSKNNIRYNNIPVIPQRYFVELNEAQSAIKDVIAELEKSPIDIDTLNTRVDTARDLALKLYNKTKEICKCAGFAEMAIVYGNRYRSNFAELDKNIAYSEILFYKGEYKKALNLCINALNKVEPGIYDKLINYYGKEKV